MKLSTAVGYTGDPKRAPCQSAADGCAMRGVPSQLGRIEMER
jgi:hypothetical protein